MDFLLSIFDRYLFVLFGASFLLFLIIKIEKKKREVLDFQNRLVTIFLREIWNYQMFCKTEERHFDLIKSERLAFCRFIEKVKVQFCALKNISFKVN